MSKVTENTIKSERNMNTTTNNTIRVELTQAVFYALQPYLNEVRDDGQQIILRYHGKDLLALVPLADLDMYDDLKDRVEIPLFEEDLAEADSIPLSFEDFMEGVWEANRLFPPIMLI